MSSTGTTTTGALSCWPSHAFVPPARVLFPLTPSLVSLPPPIPHHINGSRRAPGDGHDFMWYKLMEFSLSLPLCIGFLTTSVATLMAFSLVLEAFTAWSWWSSSLGPGYVIHAREHFMVNVVRRHSSSAKERGIPRAAPNS